MSFNAVAEECIFSESAYLNFINEYALKDKTSRIESDKKTLVIKRNNEEIIVNGGGCVHLGASITLKSKHSHTEDQFLEKILLLTKEYGGWLINISALTKSIKNRNFQIINNVYYFEIDAMTVFSASYDNKGKINIEFYIN